MTFRLRSIIQQALMGMISPKKETVGSKPFVFLVAIIFLPILLLYAILYAVWGIILCIAIWLTWRKQIVLLVYSNSPIWKDYIEREILPHLQDRGVILNWSDRRKWKNSLPVLAFYYFGGYRNFNPIAIVFRPFHLVKTYRFFEAFKEFKHGDPKNVEELKQKLFNNLGI